MQAADLTIGFLLQPDRAARMVAQHAIDPALPGLEDVVKALRAATFAAPAATAYEQEIRRATARVLAEQLMTLAGSAPMPQVRAIATQQLEALPNAVMGAPATTGDAAFRTLLAGDVKRFLERPLAPITPATAPDAPPGAPIGDPGMDWLARPAWSCGWDDRIGGWRQ